MRGDRVYLKTVSGLRPVHAVLRRLDDENEIRKLVVTMSLGMDVFDVDLSLTAIEASFGRAFTRVHRRWLVNASHIKELERDGDETRLFVGPVLSDGTQGVRVPVARERAVAVRNALLANATGLRRT